MNEMEINFLKMVLLLMKGGLFILRQYLFFIVSQMGMDIDDILKEKRKVFDEFLQRKVITADQHKILFPDSGVKTKVSEWDISLLTFVLLNCCQSKIDKQIEQAITKLRDKRNVLLAHKANTELSTVDFRCNWDDLKLTLMFLSRNLTISDQSELGRIVEEISKQRLTSERVQLDQLEQLPGGDELREALFKNILKELLRKTEENDRRSDEKEKRDEKRFRKQEEMSNKLEEKFQRQSQQIQRQSQQIQIQSQQISLLMKFHFKSEDEATRVQAQKDFLERMQSQTTQFAACNIEDDELGESIHSFVEDISDKGGVVQKAEEGSVLLTIICLSRECLNIIAGYLTCPEAKSKIHNIQCALQKRFKEVVTLDIEIIDVSAGFGVVTDEPNNCTTVNTTLLCGDVENVRKLIEYFGSGNLRYRLTEISQAISRSTGGNVEIMAELELPNLQNLRSDVCSVRDKTGTSKYPLMADESLHYTILRDVLPTTTVSVNEPFVIDRKFQVGWSKTNMDICLDERERAQEDEYWLRCVYALMITCNALRTLVMEEFYSFLMFWDLDDRMHLAHFLKNCWERQIHTIPDEYLKTPGEYTVPTNCLGCFKIAKWISSFHLRPSEIKWTNVGPSFLPEYWRIAKLYVTNDKISHRQMEIFTILENFEGFEKTIEGVFLNSVNESANKLLNGRSVCSRQEMDNLFEKMKGLLKSKACYMRPECYIALQKITQIQNDLSIPLTYTAEDNDDDYNYDISSIEELLEIMKPWSVEYDDIASLHQGHAIKSMYRYIHGIAEELSLQQQMRDKFVLKTIRKKCLPDVSRNHEVLVIFLKQIHECIDIITPLIQRTAVGTVTGVGLCIFGGGRNISPGIIAGIVIGTAVHLVDKFR